MKSLFRRRTVFGGCFRAAFAYLVLLMAAGPVYASKHYISGQVIDRNGEGLSRATVRLIPGNVELITDVEGRFLIDYLRDEEGERSRLQKKTDYTLEVFKPGFHLFAVSVFYTRGPVVMDPITILEETIRVQDHGENLDPGLFSESTHSSGAAYEGQ